MLSSLGRTGLGFALLTLHERVTKCGVVRLVLYLVVSDRLMYKCLRYHGNKPRDVSRILHVSMSCWPFIFLSVPIPLSRVNIYPLQKSQERGNNVTMWLKWELVSSIFLPSTLV